MAKINKSLLFHNVTEGFQEVSLILIFQAFKYYHYYIFLKDFLANDLWVCRMKQVE